MSDARAIIDMYVNVEKFSYVTLSGTTFLTPAQMELRRGTQVLFRCHLMLNDGTTYFTPPAGCSWLFGIDNVYTQAHTDLVVSSNADFVASDWTGSDFQNGKVCWRADLTSDSLKTALADAASATMYCALWMTPSGGKATLMAHWDITMRNVAVDPTSATPEPGILYDTIDRADSTYQKMKTDMGEVWFKDGKQLYLYCVATGKYHRATLDSQQGAVILTIDQTGEDMA
jgi:hypothetical protein